MVKLFRIRDKDGRDWGEFRVTHFGGTQLHGILDPGEDFECVRQVFIRHEDAFSNPEVDVSASAASIINLGAYLVDVATDDVIELGGRIFINSDLLVSCELAYCQVDEGPNP